MINDDTQVDDLEITLEDTDEDTDNEDEEEQGVEYWKAEALKNKAILDRNKQKKETKPTPSDELGYDVKAYLKTSGINANEFDFVKAELKASGKDLDSLLESKYFQENLEQHRALNNTANAVVKGKRNTGVATDSVEYWAGKDFAEVPLDMRGKVLAHRENSEKTRGTFYNS